MSSKLQSSKIQIFKSVMVNKKFQESAWLLCAEFSLGVQYL